MKVPAPIFAPIVRSGEQNRGCQRSATDDHDSVPPPLVLNDTVWRKLQFK
jgi:hypothetical protein